MCAEESPQLVLARRSPETVAETVRSVGHDGVALSVVNYGGDVRWMADGEPRIDASDVHVVSTVRSGGDGEKQPPAFESLPWSVETVPAGKLASLGVAVDDFLGADRDVHATVLVDSLDALVEEFGLQRTFRFVHVLRQRVEVSDATLSFRTDPETDEETLATLEPLFERVDSLP